MQKIIDRYVVIKNVKLINLQKSKDFWEINGKFLTGALVKKSKRSGTPISALSKYIEAKSNSKL